MVTPVYTTTTKVASLLQVTDFGTTTTPTAAQVEEIINRKEDYIDNRSGHSWRAVTINNEYRNVTNYEPGVGFRIDLHHRNLRTFSNGTDKIEVWNGSSWEDYVASKSAGDGPTAGDYWVDYTNGVIYINNRLRIWPKGVRVTYRFGDSSVDNTVEDIATKLTAIDVLTMNDLAVNFVEDGGTVRPTHDQRIQRWTDDIEKQFAEIGEYRVIF